MNRNGFILPLALVIMVTVSMVAVTALQVSVTDFQANRGSRLAVRALYAADAGSQRTIARWESGPYGALEPGDSVVSGWASLPDRSQYRTVVRRLDDGTAEDPMFSLLTEGRPSRESLARRRIITVLQGGGGSTPCCRAAIAVNGRLRVDRDGMLDGRDHTPAGWGSYCPSPEDPLAAILASEEDDLAVNRNGVLEGEPTILYDDAVGWSLVSAFGGMTYQNIADRADIVLSGRSERLREVEPQARSGVCDTRNEDNWGAPEHPWSSCWDYVPIIHAQGNLRIDEGEGQGILLVDGNLSIRGDFRFYGLVVVQGTLDLRDDGRLTGGLLVGNNDSRGQQSRIRRDAVVEYSSCAVARSWGDFGGSGEISPLPVRGWFEASP